MSLLFVPVISSLLLFFLAVTLFSSGFVFWISILFAFFSLLLSLFFYVSDRFTGEGVNQAVFFHLYKGFEGVDIFSFKFELIVFLSFVFLSVVFFVFIVNFRCRRPVFLISPFTQLVISFSVTCFAVFLHPSIIEAKMILSQWWSPKDLIVLNHEMSSFEDFDVSVSDRRDLVFVYAESLERTFFEDSLFPGLISKIEQLEAGGLSFSGIRQAPMTDWTIAGMVSSQCGIPLATYKSNRNDFSDGLRFVPGATCIGDVLRFNGYRNVYVGGASLDFAGKGRFYKEHGFDEVYGMEELQAVADNSLATSKWGVYDDRVFEFSLEKFKELADESERFSLFVLTLDTHPPSGHVTPGCDDVSYGAGEYPILNAVKCADSMIYDFVLSIEEEAKARGRDVLVVVASDHLMMRNDASGFFEGKDEERENLFIVRGENVPMGVVERESTTLDIYPTLLYMLGWDVDSLALGRNLLSEQETLVEKYGKHDFFEMVKKWRMGLWKTWSADS
ncbi:sulfatase-like hydrolase/transferase [Marichromatium gracile]|uniref:sulfatase-like hydrolase/transferase n=1 Tax=Marichromatium gracile TaxID=1048 RepID=UPI000B02A7E4|nr:sulfatase-like hydrolase/transferase [Marichromatium gracile]